MKTKAYITPHKDKIWYDISFKYIPELIQNIKELIPSSMRNYDPEKRLWSIHYSALKDAKNILELYFDSVVAEEFKHEEPKKEFYKTSNEFPERDIFERIFEVCPPQNIDSLYRTLSKSFHPDTGGSDAYMKKINTIYERYKNGRR